MPIYPLCITAPGRIAGEPTSPRRRFRERARRRSTRTCGFQRSPRVDSVWLAKRVGRRYRGRSAIFETPMPESRFQSFADLGGPTDVKPRIAALRAALSAQKLTGFVIPRADRHQNEYLPPDQERLLWATGFSGSAGLAIVLQDKAALFVDGRYTVQAAQQTDTDVFERLPAGEKAAQSWLAQNLRKDDALGFDPWNHTYEFVQELSALCERLGARFAALQSNPIDALWTDRPAPSRGPVTSRPLRLAGERADAKLARLRARLGADALFVSDPH